MRTLWMKTQFHGPLGTRAGGWTAARVSTRNVMKVPYGQSAPYAEILTLLKAAHPHARSTQFDEHRQYKQNGQCFVVLMHEAVVHVRNPPLSGAPRLPTISAVQQRSSQTAYRLGVSWSAKTMVMVQASTDQGPTTNAYRGQVSRPQMYQNPPQLLPEHCSLSPLTERTPDL